MKKILSNQNEKGITLIALVVTIVVLLVIAGTSLDMLLGDNGIIRQTQEAKEQAEISDEKETIKLAYNALKIGDINKAITAQEMEDEINRTKGANTVEVTGNGTLTVKFLKSNREYEMNVTTGSIKNKLPEVDVETLFATATKHEEQERTEDIGMAEDGTRVNLDLWRYEIKDGVANLKGEWYEGTYENPSGIQESSYGYYHLLRGEEVPLVEVEGKGYTIYGEIPMYIKTNGEIYSVTQMENTFLGIYDLNYVPEIPLSVISMDNTFSNCTKLTTAPEIPSNVISMDNTFSNCKALTAVPKISEGVTDMINTFEDCTSLTTAPEIPSSVKIMQNTFEYCTSLTTVPKISEGVTDMINTFEHCTNLTTVPEIPLSVTNMEGTFYGCTNLTTAPEIPLSVTNMEGTFEGCTNLTTAPEIPSSVTNMNSTFYGCSNLTGTLTINANPTNYYKCLYNAATNSTLKLNGTSTKLNEILATKGIRSNITIEGQ